MLTTSFFSIYFMRSDIYKTNFRVRTREHLKTYFFVFKRVHLILYILSFPIFFNQKFRYDNPLFLTKQEIKQKHWLIYYLNVEADNVLIRSTFYNFVIIINTTLCDNVCQWLATDHGFRWLLRFPPSIKLTATI
jgi:hypothetical protein